MRFARGSCAQVLLLLLFNLQPSHAAISPDPVFGTNGVMDIRLGAVGAQPQILKFHIDPNGNLWGIGYVREHTPPTQQLRQFLFSANQIGQPRTEVGRNGFVFPELGGCISSEPGIASSADTLYIASTVAPGQGCEGRAVRLWSVSAADGFRPKTILDSLPGGDRASVALQADGRVAVAVASENSYPDSRHTIRAYRAGVDSALQPGFTWNTTAVAPQLVFIGPPPFRPSIEASTDGGWILSYRYMSTFTDLRLSADMKIIKNPESVAEPSVTLGVEGSAALKTRSSVRAVNDFNLQTFGEIVIAANRITGIETRTTLKPGIDSLTTAVLAANGDVFWVDGVNPVGLRIARKRWLDGQYGPTQRWEARTPSRISGPRQIIIPSPNGDDLLLAYITGSGLIGNSEEVDPWRVVRFQLDESATTQFESDTVIEFFNSLLGHYFITGSATEVDAIRFGLAGPGWAQTGLHFYAFEKSPPANALPVCRFYGQPPLGPNSHFYTLDPIECEAVKKDRGWKYEGIAFYAIPPLNGQCPADTVPVWRAYNNGYARNDSNHRYSTDRALLATLAGWSLEGVVFCSPN